MESGPHAVTDAAGAFDLAAPTAAGTRREQSDAIEYEVLALFDDCGRPLVRYAASFGLAADAAEDVVQEAFLALFRHLRLDRARHSLRGWLFRVTHNLALKERTRRQHALTAGSPSARDAEPAAAEVSPEQRLVDRERRGRLLAVVQALPERDRQCLWLRANGLRYREIGRVLDMSLGGVSKSLARSFARLTRADDGWGP